jgi:hypothetical protein
MIGELVALNDDLSTRIDVGFALEGAQDRALAREVRAKCFATRRGRSVYGRVELSGRLAASKTAPSRGVATSSTVTLASSVGPTLASAATRQPLMFQVQLNCSVGQ